MTKESTFAKNPEAVLFPIQYWFISQRLKIALISCIMSFGRLDED